MKQFDKELRDLLYDAEMPVSNTLWDNIEKRIDTKPEKPKYWMVFMLTVLVLPILLVINSNNPSKSDFIKSTEIVNHTKQQFAYNKQIQTKNLKPTQNEFLTINSNNSDIQISNNSTSHIGEKINITTKENIQAYQSRTFSSIASEQIGSESSTIEKKDNINSVLLKFGTIAHPQAIDLISIQSVNSEYGDERPLIKRLFSAGTKCPSFKRNLKGLYLWSDVTSSYAAQSLSSKQGELSEYINARNESEHSLYSYSFSTGLGYIHPSGLFMEVGLTYDKINMKFHNKEEHIIGTEEIIHIIRDQDGIEVGTETEIRPIIGYNEIVNHNTFTQVELPLLLGFEMPVTPTFSLAVKAGPNFNLSSQNEGRIMNVEGSPFYYGDNSETKIYKDKLGVGYIAGVNLVKNLNHNMSLNMGLSVKSYDQFNNDNNPLKNSFIKYGLSTGIRYRFL